MGSVKSGDLVPLFIVLLLTDDDLEKFCVKGGATPNPGKGGTRPKGGTACYKGGTGDPG